MAEFYPTLSSDAKVTLRTLCDLPAALSSTSTNSANLNSGIPQQFCFVHKCFSKLTISMYLSDSCLIFICGPQVEIDGLGTGNVGSNVISTSRGVTYKDKGLSPQFFLVHFACSGRAWQ